MADEYGGNTHPSPTEDMVALGGDVDRLLRGEDPSTEYADDARHWIAVYRELLGFKHDILRSIRDRIPKISDSAKQEVLDTDLPVMEAEAARFEHRISFWQERLRELEKAGGSPRHG